MHLIRTVCFIVVFTAIFDNIIIETIETNQNNRKCGNRDQKNCYIKYCSKSNAC